VIALFSSNPIKLTGWFLAVLLIIADTLIQISAVGLFLFICRKIKTLRIIVVSLKIIILIVLQIIIVKIKGGQLGRDISNLIVKLMMSNRRLSCFLIVSTLLLRINNSPTS